MNTSQIRKRVLAKGNRQNLLTGGVIRIGIVILLWLAVAIPRNPSWSISQDWLTHILFSMVLLWSVFAFGAYYFRRMAVQAFLVSIIVDLVGITLLTAFTGGVYSPFAIAYLLEIVNMYYLGNFWQGTVVSLACVVFFLIMAGLSAVSGLWDTSPFTPEVTLLGNQVLWGTVFAMVVVFLSFTFALNAFMSRQVHKLQTEIHHYKKNLKDSGDELVASFHDLESVSDRYKEHRIRLGANQSNMLLSDKYSSLGWLTAGIIHEFNNPLTAIITNVESLMMNRTENLSERTRETCNRVVDCASRIQTLMQNITLTANPEAYSMFDMMNINQLIERTVSLLRFDAKRRNTEIATNLDEQLPGIRAIESQLEHMLINLCANSLEAISERRGRLVISTRIAKDYVVIEVVDNGRGIPQSDLGKIFDPLFTRQTDKPNGGLGLYVVKAIVENHNGRIFVKSTVDKGSAFTIHLPTPMKTS